MVVIGERGRFPISEVPLYREGCSTRSTLPLQGYFAHNGSVKRSGLADSARPHVNSLELTFGPHVDVVQVWSRDTRELRGGETIVLRRLGRKNSVRSY